MKREIMKKKLNDLQCEIRKIQDGVDDYTREYLNKLEKIIEEYKNKLDSNKMDASDGGTLGFRRAILEDDNLANIDSLYNAAVAVINFIVKNVESGSKGGSDVVQSKFNKLLNSDYYKNNPGYDCSEIATDFYDTAGQQGKIYRIEGKDGVINGYEYGKVYDFEYHEVYSDGVYIYDPRYKKYASS